MRIVAFAAVLGFAIASAIAAEDSPKLHGPLPTGEAEIAKKYHWPEVRHLDLTSVPYPSRALAMLDRTPNLESLILCGPRFNDSHLDELGKITTLRTLILDSTVVSDNGIAELGKARPDVIVQRSQ